MFKNSHYFLNILQQFSGTCSLEADQASNVEYNGSKNVLIIYHTVRGKQDCSEVDIYRPKDVGSLLSAIIVVLI